jgi:hypothetical protein
LLNEPCKEHEGIPESAEKGIDEVSTTEKDLVIDDATRVPEGGPR